jgi:hypothetical protein
VGYDDVYEFNLEVIIECTVTGTQVHGVGQAKQEQFGEVFLREITGFVKCGL